MLMELGLVDLEMLRSALMRQEQGVPSEAGRRMNERLLMGITMESKCGDEGGSSYRGTKGLYVLTILGYPVWYTIEGDVAKKSDVT